jgi:hypothetical protein
MSLVEMNEVVKVEVGCGRAEKVSRVKELPGQICSSSVISTIFLRQLLVTMAPKYLTDDKAGIQEFLGRFDVSCSSY